MSFMYDFEHGIYIIEIRSKHYGKYLTLSRELRVDRPEMFVQYIGEAIKEIRCKQEIKTKTRQLNQFEMVNLIVHNSRSTKSPSVRSDQVELAERCQCGHLMTIHRTQLDTPTKHAGNPKWMKRGSKNNILGECGADNCSCILPVSE
jgi:hypothetical protein